MTDLEPILALWRELEDAGADYVLTTVVAVEGSSYRRSGARMLLAPDGRRAGTVSGGCLETEIAKRAWWMTESGPAVERFSTFEDDGDRPYGSGCGGVVSILLERRATAAPHLDALKCAFDERIPLAIATVLEGPRIGEHAFAGRSQNSFDSSQFRNAQEAALESLAQFSLEDRLSKERRIVVDGEYARAWCDYRPARPGLWIFGAGDDAKPLVRLARELGWFTAVADGRSHLAARERFPLANEVHTLNIASLPGHEFSRLDVRAGDAGVVMTHSFEQDSRMLACLLAMDTPPAYIGVLGPQRRTREMLAEAARLLHWLAHEEQIEEWLAAIYAPTGLDLGADTPASIALSILSEIQKTLAHGTGEPLSVVRAAKPEIAGA
jgi:xanthine dehydrogenase accessory factor